MSFHHENLAQKMWTAVPITLFTELLLKMITTDLSSRIMADWLYMDVAIRVPIFLQLQDCYVTY